jgi:outer membrane protein assembly factor BamB
VGNEYSTPINVFSTDGKMLWHTWEQVGSESKSKTDYTGYHLTDMVFLDADEDKVKDVVFGTKYNRIYALDVQDGKTKWVANAGDEVNVLENLEDLVKGVRGIAAGTGGGDIVRFSAKGKRLGALYLGQSIVDMKKIAYPEKGRIDIIALLGDGSVVVADHNLKLLAFKQSAMKPLKLACHQKGNAVHITVVGRNKIKELTYLPFFRRSSRFY